MSYNPFQFFTHDPFRDYEAEFGIEVVTKRDAYRTLRRQGVPALEAWRQA